MTAQQRVETDADDTRETLTLENPAIIRLVTEVSVRTGESEETVIETALLERLERLRGDGETFTQEVARRERIYDAVRDLQDGFRKYPEARIDHAELLYGDDGLPK